MNIRELSIGDWVQNPLGAKGWVNYIRFFHRDRYDNYGGCYSIEMAYSKDGDSYCTLEENEIKPIPITPEILEKNGFIKDEDRGNEFGQTYHILIPTGYEAHSFTVQVTIYKEPIQGVDVLFKCLGWIPPFNGGLDDIHMCSLKYVHQIQHALRLCGLTDLADNFKV